MEFELELKGPFWVEISSNDCDQMENDQLTSRGQMMRSGY